MENEFIDVESMNPDELNSYRILQARVQKPVIDFEQLTQFPPFSIDGEKANSFMQQAWKIFYEGNETLRKRIPENFRPWSQFEKDFSNEIQEARKYREKSQENPLAAVKMYIEDNPDLKLNFDEFR